MEVKLLKLAQTEFEDGIATMNPNRLAWEKLSAVRCSAPYLE
jgi:hypothetical protein